MHIKKKFNGALDQFNSHGLPELNSDFIKNGLDFNFTMEDPFKDTGLKYQIRGNRIYYETSNSYTHKETIYNIAGYPERFIEEFRSENVERSINNTYTAIASLRGVLLNKKKNYGVFADTDTGEFSFTIIYAPEVKNPKIIKNLPDGYFVTENYQVIRKKDEGEGYIIVGEIEKEFI